jgi:3-oxoadipate enol-lactonase
MPLIPVNDTTLYYEVHGSGRPLVLVPGLGATHRMWQPQIEAFSPTHQVITFDPRGTGRSGKLRGWDAILQRQTADLDALLAHLNVERAVVCGVSYGGVFAQQFALGYPKRCAGLVVVDSFASTRPHTLREVMLLIAVNLLAPVYLLPRGWLEAAIRRQYTRWPLARAEIERVVREMRAYETMKVRLAINWINFIPRLPRLACPTLGIVGTASEQAVTYMERFVAAVPGARLALVSEAMDPSNLCQPERFNRALRLFLEEIGWAGVEPMPGTE